MGSMRKSYKLSKLSLVLLMKYVISFRALNFTDKMEHLSNLEQNESSSLSVIS